MLTKLGLIGAFGSTGTFFYNSYVQNIKKSKKEILDKIKFDNFELAKHQETCQEQIEGLFNGLGMSLGL